MRKIFFPVLSLVISISGLIFLTTFSAKFGTPLHVVSLSIFGSVLVVIYVIYSVLHLFKDTKYESVMSKMHSATTYVLISATYTPIYLIAFPSAWGWSMFGVSWGLSLIGVFLYCFRSVPNKIHSIIYFLVDWVIVVAFVPLYASLPFLAIKILVLGSSFYTMSVIMDRYGKLYLSQINMALGSAIHIFFMFKYILA